jgi:1,4-dihydroxy-2-naphthoate octaprenyltransferase
MGRCSLANRCQKYSHTHVCDVDQSYGETCFVEKPGMRPYNIMDSKVMLGILMFGMGIYLLGFVQSVLQRNWTAVLIIGLSICLITGWIYKVRLPYSNL